MTQQTQALMQLQSLKDAIERQAAGNMSAADLNLQARASTALMQALPERYGPVLLQLLDRLEASAMFTEESCSFSPSDFYVNLRTWTDKAQAQLEAAGETAR